MGALDHRLIASLLLSVFSFVLVMGGFIVYLIIRWRHMRGVAGLNKVTEEKDQAQEEEIHHSHLILRRPTCWLAIKNRNPMAVQCALALHNSKPCSWLEGLAGDGEQKLFVSPPVSGWILVIGSALPDPGDDVDTCFRFLVELSRKLGHVQFFNANVMLNQHAWVQAEAGRILRGYAWAGKTLWNQGATTSAENDLALKCYDYTEVADVPQFGSPDPIANNSEKVHLLAARWSIDPDDIDERFIEHEWGIVGEPSRLF